MKSTLYLLTSLALLGLIYGHGFLSDPPNRASMWRFGYDTPINWDDNQFFCGGIATQWNVYDGKCGECGDIYGDPRPRSNENTGTYGTGIITRTYEASQDVDVTVNLTTNHLGYFQFSLCPLSTPEELEMEECFKNTQVQLADGTGTQYPVSADMEGDVVIKLRLPAGLTCDRCVMQWHYYTGNNWGTCENGTSGLGCGPQETFRSCADIAIEP